jgi:hypothetical protein
MFCGLGAKGPAFATRHQTSDLLARRASPDLRGTPVKLGNRSNIHQAGANGRRRAKATAEAFAANVMPIVDALRKSGVTTLAGIADALNARGVPTARGGRWHVSTVMNLLRRSARAG